MALLLSLSSYTSSALFTAGFASPALQTIPVYFCLSLCLLRVRRLTHRWWAYLLLAICDVEANYCIVTAFGLTSMTTAQVLNSATVPFVVILGRVLFKRSPSLPQALAVLVAVLGLACLITADAQKSFGENNWLGNIFSLTAALLYATCNCLEEKVLTDSGSAFEMLGMLGLCGTVLSATQAFILESPLSVNLGSEVLMYWGSFVVCMVSFYGSLSFFLARWDASFFNLSILTASVYTAAIEGLVDWSKFKLGYWLYALGFLLTLTGCVVYHSSTRSPQLPK